ncbi:MAG TPA: hypothetical protein VE199_03205 [Nitrososphaera sp.]|nr:hypothetical protein [Nitrososphaera sp.]
MGRTKAAKETQQGSGSQEDQSLPKWAEDEIKSVQFNPPEVIVRTGYILDIYESDYKIDIQVYEPMPDGRSIVEGLDVPKSMKISDFMKGFVYEFKINMFTGPLSAKVVELLKTKFALDMRAIYRFELKELQLMDVESDLPSESSSSAAGEDADEE